MTRTSISHVASTANVIRPGLGLAIVAECVEATGGSIRAESTLGGGTSFFVTLPQHGEA